MIFSVQINILSSLTLLLGEDLAIMRHLLDVLRTKFNKNIIYGDIWSF